MAIKVGDVFLQITTNAKKAADDLRQVTDLLAQEVGLFREGQEANKKLQDVAEKGTRSYRNQLRKIIAEIEKEIATLKEQRAALGDLESASEERYQNELRRLKKLSNRYKILATEQERRESAFTDYAGTEAEQRARAGEKVAANQLRNLEGFLSRATMQHNRYADMLDRRDMTGSVIENIRRGVQKGLLISERWHRDENALQKIARGFGIAGTAFDRVRSYSERAADAFYTLQRVGYLVQTALSVLLGSIGALVGGLMGLAGVAGVAAASLISVASAMTSVVGGFISARIGFGGIGRAVGQAWQQQRGYAGSLRDTRRELRNLRFDAEEAALSQQEAALNLERAREELARVQDLPPDSRVRREAELQFQQAELAYRRAKARNEDLRRDVERGTQNPQSLLGGGGAQDPFADLTASQRKFAEYLVTLRPKMMELREASAAAFLGPLEDATRLLVSDLFPTLKIGLADLGGAMGRAALIFAEAITAPDNLDLLAKFFKNSIPVIENFGRAMGSAFGGVLALLEAADPLTQRFATWIADSAARFETWAKTGLADGSLTEFFNLAGDVAAKIGDIFRNVYDGIKNIVNATFPGGNENAGAGGVILRWLDGITTGFAAFTGAEGFSVWLENTTTTATVAISTIGDFLGIMLDIADEPGLRGFWETIRQAVDPIRSIFRDGVQAGPAFARLFVSIANVLEVLSDSVALSIFMDTLAAIFEMIEGILQVFKPFIEQIGRFHAVILAVTAALFLFRKAGMVFFGIFEKMANTLGIFSKNAHTAVANSTAITQRFREMQVASKAADIGVTGLAGAAARTRTFMTNLGRATWEVSRAGAAMKNKEFLLSMARAAGAATNEVRALTIQLNAAIKAGKTTIPTMTAFVGSSRSRLAQQAVGRAPMISPMMSPPTAGGIGRVGGGAISALSMAGIAGAIGSSIGMSMGGPVSQIVGAVGLFGSMIPGLPGLIIGALGGLGSLVIGAIEGANLNANIDPKVEQMRVQQQYIAKTTELGKSMMDSFTAAGISATVGAAAVDAIRSFAFTAGKTPTAVGAGLGREQITRIMEQILATGGPEIAKILSAPGSDAAKAIMQNAVTAAINAGGQGKPLTAEQIANAAAMAINAQQQGTTLEIYKVVGETVLTGIDAQNSMLEQAAGTFKTAIEDASVKVADAQWIVNRDQFQYDSALRALDAAKSKEERERAQAKVDELKAILDTSNSNLATAQTQLDTAREGFASAWKEQGGKLPLIADRLAGPLDIKPRNPLAVSPISIAPNGNTVKWDSTTTGYLKSLVTNTSQPPKVTNTTNTNTTQYITNKIDAKAGSTIKVGSG